MTPYQSKLKDLIIATGKAAEKAQRLPTPTMPVLKILYDKYLAAVESGDMSKQLKTSRALTAALVKWQVETL
jgi:hypothetical protein